MQLSYTLPLHPAIYRTTFRRSRPFPHLRTRPIVTAKQILAPLRCFSPSPTTLVRGNKQSSPYFPGLDSPRKIPVCLQEVFTPVRPAPSMHLPLVLRPARYLVKTMVKERGQCTDQATSASCTINVDPIVAVVCQEVFASILVKSTTARHSLLY